MNEWGSSPSAVVLELSSMSLWPAALVTAERDVVVAKECGIPSLNTGSIAQHEGYYRLGWSSASGSQTAVPPLTERLKCHAAPLNLNYAKFISPLT